MARRILDATKKLVNFTVEHETNNGSVKCEQNGALLVNGLQLLRGNEEMELSFDSIEQKYSSLIGLK